MPFGAEDASDEMTDPAEQVLAEFRYVVVFDRVHDIECVWMTARRTLAEDHQRARHDVGPLDGDRNRRRFVHHADDRVRTLHYAGAGSPVHRLTYQLAADSGPVGLHHRTTHPT